MKDELRRLADAVYAIDGKTYPAPTMIECVHKPTFEAARGITLDHHMQLQKACLVMLAEEDIISRDHARVIRQALDGLSLDEFRTLEYDPENGEDMFFTVERRLMEQSENLAANLHIGRSRNDIGATLIKMDAREYLLELIEQVDKLLGGLIAYADAHKHTLFTAYTHTQQAQPSTIGHYMSGIVKMLERDLRRLHAAFDCTQENPMGAGAITTSGFPINRETLRDLLGFETMMENSYDCIAAGDYIAEIAGAIAILSVDIGRLINNLLVWSAEEYGFLEPSRAYIGISSMMPQKRNPTAMEHLHSFASELVGKCHAIQVIQHNTNYEDVLDHTDSKFLLHETIQKATVTVGFLYNVVITMDMDAEKLRERAMNSYSVLTEFADMLVREEKVDYRNAHHVASGITDLCLEQKIGILDVTDAQIAEVFERIIGRPPHTDPKVIARSLDAENFVKVRKVLGGPADEPMNAMLAGSRAAHQAALAWTQARRQRIDEAKETLEARLKAL